MPISAGINAVRRVTTQATVAIGVNRGSERVANLEAHITWRPEMRREGEEECKEWKHVSQDLQGERTVSS